MHMHMHIYRRFSKFNPSKDLPCSTMDAHLLWLNKASSVVCLTLTEDGVAIPRVSQLCSCLCDGQCLAALLLLYAPQLTKWSGACTCHLDINNILVRISFGKLLK